MRVSLFTRIICLGIFVALTGQSFGQTASAIIRKGEQLPGGDGQVVDSISNSATNNVGGYSFTINADGLSTIWGSTDGSAPSILAVEGMIGDFEITGFESFFGMSDSGSLCYGTTAVGGLDGVFLDDVLLLNEDEAVENIPGSFSTFNSRPGVTASSDPYWVGGITDAKGGSTQQRVLFFGSNAQPVIQTGDSIVGVAGETISASGIDFNVRFSHCAVNYIMASSFQSAVGTEVVHINGEAVSTSSGGIILTGSPIPLMDGGIGDNFDNFDFYGVGDNGNYMVTGDSDGNTATDEFILIDGEIVLREGDMIGAAALSGTIDGAFMNDDGDWAAVWDADIGPANLEVLILNGEIILTEGQTVDWNGDGVIDKGDSGAVLTDFTGITSLTMSRVNASGNLRIYFTADVDIDGTEVEGGFVIEAAGNPVLTGDLNGDDRVDLLDVAPFVKALVSQTYVPAADINFDNVVNLLDIEPFIQEIMGG